MHESHRQLEATKYTIADYEATIHKFRELVSQLQDQNRDLREDSSAAAAAAALVAAASSTSTTSSSGAPGAPGASAPSDAAVIEFDFKTKFAETKAYAQTIQMELRALDLEQCNKQVQLLTSFMPETFFRRGGDNDALQVMLLIPRESHDFVHCFMIITILHSLVCNQSSHFNGLHCFNESANIPLVQKCITKNPSNYLL